MKSGPLYLFGTHATHAALANPMRKIRRVMVTKGAEAELGNRAKNLKNLSITDSHKLESLLPPGSVHQGIVVECAPLEQPSLQEWLAEEVGKPVLVLDQVSDPHNVGAVLRSAAAFDAGAVVATDRGVPAESGVMAKAASGALEQVPLIAVVNLSQALELLKKAGYWTYGLDGEAKQSIGDANLDVKTALVLGAEGRGLRRLTAERCDALVKLPMSNRMESLNVSNAAAIALYDLYRRR